MFDLSKECQACGQEVVTALETLESSLWNSHNLPLRNDSRLAYLWCTGQLLAPYNSIEDVVHELYCTHVLNQNTEYFSTREVAAKIMADDLIANKRIDWKSAWDIVKRHYFDILKYHSMIKGNIRF